MPWNPHRYEKRVAVDRDGEVRVAYLSFAYVFEGSRNDCDISKLVERYISPSAYAAAKKRGGVELAVSVSVPVGVEVHRTQA